MGLSLTTNSSSCSNTSRELWVNAVCLDQSNPTELAQQVPKMQQIYFNATDVLVWLGQDEASLRTPLAEADSVGQADRIDLVKLEADLERVPMI